jgi:hypothetical protein
MFTTIFSGPGTPSPFQAYDGRGGAGAVVEAVFGVSISAQLANKATTKRAIALRNRERPIIKMRTVMPSVFSSILNI